MSDDAAAECCSSDGLHAYYGSAHILEGVSFSMGARRSP